jgi:hypothetical protein
MQYMLLIATSEAVEASMDQNALGEIIAAYGPYTDAMVEAGVLVSGQRLRESTTATTVSIRDGKTNLLDGPYAETKEQLGGFYIIEAPDLDTAISWAARCPSAHIGSIEVRPIWPM